MVNTPENTPTTPSNPEAKKATEALNDARAYLISYKESEPGSEQARQALQKARGHFTDFFNVTEPLTYRRILARTGGDIEASNDILQEVYEHAFRALPSYRGEGEAETWLYRITINRIIDYAKYESHRKHGPLDEEENFRRLSIDPTTDPQWVVEHNVLREELRDVLSELSPSQRHIVVIRHVLDQTIQGTADLMGNMPLGTAKAYAFRGLKKAGEIIEKRRRSGDSTL